MEQEPTPKKTKPKDVARDVWSGEGDICQKITAAMRGLDAAGATGILAKKEEEKK